MSRKLLMAVLVLSLALAVRAQDSGPAAPNVETPPLQGCAVPAHVQGGKPGRVSGLVKSPELMQLYTDNNWRYFEGKLPPAMPVFWAKKITLGGQRDIESVAFAEDGAPIGIFIDAKLRKCCGDYARELLLHAQNHISTRTDDESPEFQAGMRRLAAAGAFDGLW